MLKIRLTGPSVPISNATIGGVMDRSARDFPMPSFLQQITPFRYTVLDWEQARKIPAISYLAWIPSSTTWYRYAAMK